MASPPFTRPSSAFPTLGIMGGGQLGRMTALAAIRMGLNVRFLVPAPAPPVEQLGVVTVGNWKDADVLRAFAEGCDAVTVESEWGPADEMANVLPDGVALWPAPATLQTIRDKGVQKRMLRDAGLPVPAFANCATQGEALSTASAYGYPALLKRFRGSYDGYGNATIHSPADLEAAWPKLADHDGLLVEAWVPFVRELAVLVARRPSGETAVYPVAYTEQRDHRCHAVVVPAAIDEAVAREAQTLAVKAVETVNGVGLTAVELFELADGSLLINEMAPRPHNTGHYSIEGSHTSQFENHVRGVLDLPLGAPDMRTPVAVMINVLGHRTRQPSSTDGYREALAIPGVDVHLYGKGVTKPKRKMGHVTATGSDPTEVRERAERAAALIQL
ncbi:MAG: 5-(carboxyamino)imidazole ribonucleotide synthase [Bacteroidota bacterium]